MKYLKSRKKDREHYLITDKTVPFNITESYKAMRTNLIFALSTSDKKIVASLRTFQSKSLLRV